VFKIALFVVLPPNWLVITKKMWVFVKKSLCRVGFCRKVTQNCGYKAEEEPYENVEVPTVM
jgi:hypothetical protein